MTNQNLRSEIELIGAGIEGVNGASCPAFHFCKASSLHVYTRHILGKILVSLASINSLGSRTPDMAIADATLPALPHSLSFSSRENVYLSQYLL